MPSINEIVEVARPVIAAEVRKAVLAERAHVAREVLRVLDHGADGAGVRAWCDANLALIEAPVS